MRFDSILVDEARTPLIISGPVDTVNTAFADNRPVVQKITTEQNRFITERVAELKKCLANNDEDRIKELLYIIHKGSPKERDFIDIIMKDAKVKGVFDRAIAEYDSKMMESERIVLLENLFFTFEERSREVIFTGKGESFMKNSFNIDFMIDDIEAKLAEISGDEDVSEEQRMQKEEDLTKQYVEQQKQVDSIKAVVKSFCSI